MQRITAQNAPEAIGPYSHAVRTGNLLITSGQIPIDPSTGSLVVDLIEDQTNQVMANLKAILENEGLSFMNVVKTTVF
ncbi:MAG: reactive intermediate/imine deaminase, partial [Verrucomicrobiales bacterium]|nr:reactive intermediate/imine deaminase [Verrucomicrobiales bacterium]